MAFASHYKGNAFLHGGKEQTAQKPRLQQPPDGLPAAKQCS